MKQLEGQGESPGYADAFNTAAIESQFRVEAHSKVFPACVQNDVYHHTGFSDDYQLLNEYQPTDTIDLHATSASYAQRSPFQVLDTDVIYKGSDETNKGLYSGDTHTETMKEFIARIEAEAGYKPEIKQELDQDNLYDSVYYENLGAEMIE